MMEWIRDSIRLVGWFALYPFAALATLAKRLAVCVLCVGGGPLSDCWVCVFFWLFFWPLICGNDSLTAAPFSTSQRNSNDTFWWWRKYERCMCRRRMSMKEKKNDGRMRWNAWTVDNELLFFCWPRLFVHRRKSEYTLLFFTITFQLNYDTWCLLEPQGITYL